ncbi:MAG: M20/M25/M40 family metallo-hydrolase [Thermaerobacter sp.]|nr:M20/M25/M40 family metallo-hydrolase [Thermaerobacter sp.]
MNRERTRVIVPPQAVVEEALCDLQQILAIPSVNPMGDMRPIAGFLAQRMEFLGFAVRRDEVPPAEVQAHHMRCATNLMGQWHQGDDAGLLLNAHFDTTDAGAGWTVDPYQGLRQNGKIFGRGAQVSKSDVVMYLYAVALAARYAKPTFPVTVALTGDEEVGGMVGPYRLLREKLVGQPALAICPGTTYQVVDHHDGVLQWAVTIGGKGRHAAIHRAGGDAVEDGAELIRRLYRYRRDVLQKQGGWLTVGVAQGGEAPNMVAGEFVLKLDRRVGPDESIEKARAAVSSVLDEWKHEVGRLDNVRVHELVVAYPLRAQPNANWAKWVARQAQEVLEREVDVTGSPLYTDARHFSARGIPTICYGVGRSDLETAGAHGTDEFVYEEDFAKGLTVLTNVIVRLWQEGLSGVVGDE